MTLLWHYYDTIMTLLLFPLWHCRLSWLWHYYDTIIVSIITLLWHYYSHYFSYYFTYDRVSSSGIQTPPIYFDILVYHTEICWCTMLYDVRRHHCIYSYMSKYEMISLHILGYTSISYMTVYGGICLFMTVYLFEIKYIPSYTMLTLWHGMLMHLYNLTYV